MPDQITTNPPTQTSTMANCARCEHSVDKEETMTEVDGQQWCEDCDATHAVECNHCGKRTSVTNACEIDGQQWCEDCDASDAVECNHCGKRTSVTNACKIDGQQWCEDCVGSDSVTCNYCGDLTNSDRTALVDGNMWCPSCAYSYSIFCAACGNRTDSESAQSGSDDNVYCPYCEVPHQESLAVYDYHSFHGNLTKHGNIRGFLAGFELEAGKADAKDAKEAASQILALDPDHKHYHVETDMSIPNYGWELISMPHDLASHRAYDWKKVLGIMEAYNMKANSIDGCGLHVHVSRRGGLLSRLDLAKIDLFVAHNRDWFELLARRNSDHYAAYKHKSAGEWGSDSDRYRAVNFRPRETVEFRLWKSSLDPRVLMATIELSVAVCMFVKTQTVMQILRQDKMAEFKVFLADQKMDAATWYVERMVAKIGQPNARKQKVL